MTPGWPVGITRALAVLLCALTLGAAPGEAAADEVIIGELNSYKALPLYTENYRKGWQLAVDEINKAGGIHGRLIRVIDRDDLGRPEDAVRIAEELVTKDKIHVLSGCIFGNVCSSLAAFAEQKRIPTMRWFGNPADETKREGNFAFGLNSLFVTARAPAAYALEKHADLAAWESIAPNYTYGHQATAIFAAYLKTKKPDTKWGEPYWYPVGKLDAAATIGAIAARGPDAVMNASFGADVSQLIRMSARRQFDKDKVIVSLETGMPEYLDTVGAEAPVGWIMTGYPRDDIDTPAHQTFAAAYEKMHGQKPGWMSLNGYNAYQFIFAALKDAPDLKPENIVKAMEGVSVDTPIGTLTMRQSDHFSTQGIWVGQSIVVDGKPKLAEWKYYPGGDFLIAEDKVVSAP